MLAFYISSIGNKCIFVQRAFVSEEKKPTKKPLNRWLKKQPCWFSMQAYACAWDWKPTFHGPNVRAHKKNILFRAFQLPCDPSKPFLMQTQQKTQSVKLRKSSPSLCFFSPSHYLICYCGYTINFPLCLSGSSFIQFIFVLRIMSFRSKSLQSERIDSGVHDSNSHIWYLLFLPAISPVSMN